jgi:hypothetical protein
VGLAIAILCMAGHLILANTSKKLSAELETGAVTFENLLILRKQAEK